MDMRDLSPLNRANLGFPGLHGAPTVAFFHMGWGTTEKIQNPIPLFEKWGLRSTLFHLIPLVQGLPFARAVYPSSHGVSNLSRSSSIFVRYFKEPKAFCQGVGILGELPGTLGVLVFKTLCRWADRGLG
jgi:hypothetical protein